jgi:hypothetical protein
MTIITATPKFHEQLIFDLLERLLDYAMAAEGVRLLNVETIGLLRRAAEMTEGSPSEIVQKVYREIFLRDLWEKLPPYERRPGVVRRFTAERLELASLDD